LGAKTEIEIRKIDKIIDFFGITEVQKQVWINCPLVITSPHLVKVHVDMGALVLGAYAPDGQVVGFVYSFPGHRRGEQMHWSHMLGVIPDHRRKGLGKLLKLRQRAEILKTGIELCSWTFDPLQAVNARLNIVALGARTSEYLVDAYGSEGGYLDGGLPTDRLVAKWELTHPRVVECAEGRPERASFSPRDLQMAYQAEKVRGVVSPSKPDLSLKDSHIGLIVPPEINGLKSSHPKTALRWRLVVRQTIPGYFEKGYSLVDCLTPRESVSPNFVYILHR
jgi:predicted GNAT superfamily acetyltransferase